MYYLIHRNVDGAGVIEDEIITTNEAGLVVGIEHRRREYATYTAAVSAAQAMQTDSDAGGNPWGYAYSVHSTSAEGALYRTYPGR